MRFFPFTVLFFLAGCGFFQKPGNSSSGTTDTRRADLQAKFDAKLAVLVTASDPETGWPSVTDCDGTLWCGVAKSVGAPCKLELAEYHPGEIHRRPLAQGECYNGRDGSSVSNDMLLGYLMGEWQAQDQEAFARLASFGEGRNWTMGDGDATRTVLRPNGVGLLGRIIFVLSGGATDKVYRRIPPAFLPVTADYEKHLQMEGIMLNGAVNAELSAKGLDGALGLSDVNDDDLKRLKELADSEPEDAMAQAAYGAFTGNQDKALALLLAAETPRPTYVRGTTDADTAVYNQVFWLKAASFVLGGK